jgi:hypothetical protein
MWMLNGGSTVVVVLTGAFCEKAVVHRAKSRDDM